ncbi:MAG: EF hand/EF hand [Verrucomicrobia bacterium]|jgi:hypothetical protein|nr:MAG: EF hand/EF hand [Verrucomicrobiota bacterium]
MKWMTAWLLFVAVVPAVAQDRKTLAGPLRKFDANRDGKLEGRELVLARQAHNRGGREAEPNPGRWRDMLERFEREFMNRRRRDFDENGDGKLDEGELREARKVWEAISEGMARVREEVTARYDRNDDGELNDEERRESKKETERLRRELEERVLAERKKEGGAGGRAGR